MSAAKPLSRRASVRQPFHTCAILLACMVAACGQEHPAAPQRAAQTAETAPDPSPKSIASPETALATHRLRTLAATALRSGHLLTPAGDSALEYYLALHELRPNDHAVASALADLQPYALIATEQGIARGDLGEARRLLALMERIDPQAPSLPRLKGGIADIERIAAEHAAEQARAQEAARRLAEKEQAQTLLREQAAWELERQRDEVARTAARREAERRESDRRAAEQQAAEKLAAKQREEAVARDKIASELHPIKTPSPRYPIAAEQSGQEGLVLVELTVATNGTVSAAHVVKAEPAAVFDDAALAAVKRWRFQPVPAPVTTQQSIRFSLGN